jgi:hypothetical protein
MAGHDEFELVLSLEKASLINSPSGPSNVTSIMLISSKRGVACRGDSSMTASNVAEIRKAGIQPCCRWSRGAAICVHVGG